MAGTKPSCAQLGFSRGHALALCHQLLFYYVATCWKKCCDKSYTDKYSSLVIAGTILNEGGG